MEPADANEGDTQLRVDALMAEMRELGPLMSPQQRCLLDSELLGRRSPGVVPSVAADGQPGELFEATTETDVPSRLEPIRTSTDIEREPGGGSPGNSPRTSATAAVPPSGIALDTPKTFCEKVGANGLAPPDSRSGVRMYPSAT